MSVDSNVDDGVANIATAAAAADAANLDLNGKYLQ